MPFNFKKLLWFFLVSIISFLFLWLGWVRGIDEDGTKEPDLVRANGNNVCQSCMGLYK